MWPHVWMQMRADLEIVTKLDENENRQNSRSADRYATTIILLLVPLSYK